MKNICFFLSLFFFAFSAHGEIFQNRLVLDQLVYTIRDPKTEPSDFRSAIEKIGEYLAIEVLQKLPAKQRTIETLTNGRAFHQCCEEKPVLVTILRAGFPLLLGMQKIFPDSEVGFFAMSRNEETLQPTTSYIALPDLKGKTVIIADTMLATGGSFLQAIEIIKKREPKKILLVAAIAAKEGIARIVSYDCSIDIVAAAVDPVLNEKGYIVPGLGDAGDRCYGVKH